MINFENPTIEKLVMRIIETLKRVNQDRKILEMPELPISQIVAPLYWRFATLRENRPIDDFVDDLFMYSDFDVKLQNNTLFVERNPMSFDLVVRLLKAKPSGHNLYSSPNRRYILSFTKTFIDDEEFWVFELHKVIDLVGGFWEPNNVRITNGENSIGYYDFIEQFDDYCKGED